GTSLPNRSGATRGNSIPAAAWLWTARASPQLSAHGDEQLRERLIAGHDADGPRDRPRPQALPVEPDVDLEGAALAARRAADAEEGEIRCKGIDLELSLALLDQPRLREQLDKRGVLRLCVRSC